MVAAGHCCHWKSWALTAEPMLMSALAISTSTVGELNDRCWRTGLLRLVPAADQKRGGSTRDQGDT